MPSRKEYEMLFQLNAELGKSFNGTFSKAQKELLDMQKELQSLSKTQSNIAAYQKQQAAVANTASRLSALRKEYDNIQREINETEGFSSSLENRLLSKQRQIERTEQSLKKYSEALNETGKALEEAGVDTADLSAASADLDKRIGEVKTRQEEAADAAADYGSKTTSAFEAAQQAIAAAGVAVALREIYQYFADCAQASMDFESAMTGVAKTTDLTDDEFAAMSADIKAMATEMPATAEEIAGVAEAAGQLGIAKKDLLDFSEVMINLGESTNLTSDEAASSLAKFANITGMAADNYSRLGATIVDLGNNFATTEADIVAMGTRLASSGAIIGLSEAEIMAVATALSSVGIEAEAGGSAISTLLKNFETMVQTGSPKLAEFAEVAGMSAEQFSEAWGENAIGTLSEFIDGLGRIDDTGGSSVAVLDELGITEIRLSNAVLALASSNGILNDAVSTANIAWQENTALTNEAEKRYATTQSRLQMMQNAYHNLQAAIGDAYTPALRSAFDVGTDVLNVATKFVEENPALVTAVGAFAGVLGTATAALALYTAGTKAAAAASAVLTKAIPGLNVIMAVTAAVAGVTAVVAGLATAARNDAVPSVEELTEATDGMREAMDEAQSTFDGAVGSTMAAASVADRYIDALEAMEAAGVKTADEHRQYHNTLALLCQIVPELSNYIDLETDTIEGGTEALRANTEAWKQNAIQQAYQERLNALYSQYSDVLIEAEENSIGYARAQAQLEVAEQKKADAVSRMNQLWDDAAAEAERQAQLSGGVADATAFLAQEYYDLQSAIYDYDAEIETARGTMDAYSAAMDKNSDAVAKAEDEIALSEEAIRNLTGASEAASGATGALSTGEQELQSRLSAVNDTVKSLAEAYSAAYEAAAESVGGQYQLWDQAAAVTATSAATINSALASQTEYWQNYNANLQALIDRSGGIAGLSDMIASFADGSAESVNAIAGMASASDAELTAMVANWQELQAAQQEAAGGVADLTTGFTTAMDELQAELAADIEAMDLSEDAQESGRATVRGFINAANSMMPDVQSAYARLASAAVAAMHGNGAGGSAGDVPHYAGGTESAEPGFALVGENGPELVYMRGGERVLNAAQTSALQSGGAIPAYASNGGGGYVITFAPVYNLAGISNAPELEAALRAHDDSLKSQLVDLLTEINADAARTGYR